MRKNSRDQKSFFFVRTIGTRALGVELTKMDSLLSRQSEFVKHLLLVKLIWYLWAATSRLFLRERGGLFGYKEDSKGNLTVKFATVNGEAWVTKFF